ncbi:unnamed protein product [Arctogadus glacialis]
MSRKKGVKGRTTTGPSTTGGSAGKSSGKAGKGSMTIGQSNGVVHPSRPAFSCSSEFYDIAFKAPLLFHKLPLSSCFLG